MFNTQEYMVTYGASKVFFCSYPSKSATQEVEEFINRNKSKFDMTILKRVSNSYINTWTVVKRVKKVDNISSRQEG